MSKSVRLKDHLVAEVERLATEERRSLAQMVELLLEQALKMDGGLSEEAEIGVVAENRGSGERAQKPAPGDSRTPGLSTASSESRPITASVKRDRPTPANCGMSNRHQMNSKLNPCPRCGYPA